MSTVTQLRPLKVVSSLQDPADMSLNDVVKELKEHGEMLRRQLVKRFDAIHAESTKREELALSWPTEAQLSEMAGLATMSSICGTAAVIFEEDRKQFSLLLKYFRSIARADAGKLSADDTPSLILALMSIASASQRTNHLRDLYKHAERIEAKRRFTGPKV